MAAPFTSPIRLSRLPRRPLAAACAVWLGALLPAQGQADSGLAVGVSQQLLHDSNVLRAPEGNAQEAWVSLSGLRLSLETPVGRGSFKANASADAVQYRHLSRHSTTQPQARRHLGLRSR